MQDINAHLRAKCKGADYAHWLIVPGTILYEDKTGSTPVYFNIVCPFMGNGGPQWTLHKLRRTYATTLLRNGVDLRTVQRFMGHSDMNSTMRYLRPASSKETQAAVNAIKWTS